MKRRHRNPDSKQFIGAAIGVVAGAVLAYHTPQLSADNPLLLPIAGGVAGFFAPKVLKR